MQTMTFRRLATVLAVLWFALNLPLLLGVRVLPSDAMFEFYPMVYFNVHSIREGLAPWWNPLIFAGYPQIADPQAMLFSPLMMAWMLLRSEPSMPWFVAGALLHVYVGGVSMLAILRRLNATDLGALFGALVFMAGGVAASRIQYVPILIAYCFTPLAMLCVLRLAENPRWGRAVALGLVAAAILVEPVQLTYLIGLILPFYAIGLGVRRWRVWSRLERVRYIAGLALGAFIALAVATPQLLFTYAFVAVSNRPALPLSAATEMSVSWSSFLTLLSPNALHSLRGTYTGPVDPIETFYWIGALPALLLLVGAKRAWANPLHRRYLSFFLAVGVFAALYMLGGHTPLYQLLYEALPGVKQFRRPSDAAYFLNLALAFGVALATSHLDLRSPRLRLGLLVVATVWLLGASISMRGAPEKWQVATVVAPIAAAIVAWILRKPVGDRTLLYGLLVVAVVDYRCFAMNGEFNQHSDSAKRFLADPASAHVARADVSLGKDGMPARVEALDLSAGWKNNVVLRDIPATHGYGPLRWSVWDRWYGSYSDGDGPRPVSPYNPNPGSALNQLLGVSVVVQPPGASTSDWAHKPKAMPIYADHRAEVLAMDGLPRLLSPSEATVLPVGESPDPVAFDAMDFRRQMVLTPRDEADATGAKIDAATCAGGDLSPVAGIVTNTRIAVRTRGQKASWLVITDPDFPGWTTTIDAQPVATHRANGLVRAVCVPAGVHEVEFTFHPWVMVKEAVRDPKAWR